MESSIQALIIILDFGAPCKSGSSPGGDASAAAVTDSSHTQFAASTPETETAGFNIFRKLMSKIESPDQLHFLFRGFSRLLNNTHQAENTYLPYSIPKLHIEQVSD